jgi:hypothetical protein
VTYPPPGNPDPFGQQPQQPDPFAPPPADPTAPPPPPPPAYDPYGQQPVSPPPSPFTPPPPAPQNPYDPYAQQQSPVPQYQTPPQYGQPYGAAQQYPYGPPMADPAKQNGMAIGSMITGIVSIVAACCCPILGLLAGIAGGVLGFLARKQIAERGGQGNGMALAGLITGGVGVLLAIVNLALAVSGVFDQNFFNDLFNSGNALY